LDIVALGTVADVVPLVDENRLFVKFGIEELKKSTKKGIGALKLVSGIERADQVSSMTVAFRLAPRINAAGRIDDQHMGVRLLTTDDAEEALELAEKLDRLNSKRQAIEAAILKEADLALKSDPSFDKEKAIVLYNEKWHIGVLGIVAARLAEAHLKPSVVIGASGGIARGSARSVGNYDIIAALSQACEHLLSFGGHAHAAGLSIDPDKIGAFRARICEIVASTLADDDRAEKIDVDCQIEPSDVTEELVKELEFLEPFGEGNKEPVFSLKEMRVSDARIVAEKHLKLKFTDKLIVLEGIGFGMGGRIVTASDILDVAFIPQRDTWKGNGAVQLKLRDICSK
jgi:single-stranded-DNA-specific exonuclease